MEHKDLNLNERHREVLLAVIEGYFETANPVGSKYVSENYRLNLGSASIRNIMASLEECGYIYQPHFAAGRIPTAAGYKFYVESLLKIEKISKKQKDTIKNDLNLENRNIHSIMGQISKSLSNISHYTGIVLAPATLNVSLLHIEFIRIKDRNILVILVFKNGVTENRMIYFYKDIKQAELNRLSGKLNNIIDKIDCGIEALKNVIRDEIDDDRENFYSILDDITIDMANDQDRNPDDSLYIGPETFLLEEPEFSHNDQVKLLIKAINDKKTIIKLLGLTKNSKTTQIFIGSNEEWSEISGLSLITAPYFSENKLLNGSIGIIGPSRMNYSQVISIIDFMAGFLSEII